VNVRLHPHAQQRIAERGATEAEVFATIEHGTWSPARYGRTCFQRRFSFGREWLGRWYAAKEALAFAVPETDGWLVITVIVRYL